MTLILILVGILIAVGSSLLVVASRTKPKKAEESERGEIFKQLLALSEADASTPAADPLPIKGPRLALAAAKGGGSLQKGARPNSKPRHPSQGGRAPVLVRSKDAEVEDQIRRRAYELYQQRGGMDGRATDDWLRAKEEVLRSTGRAGKSLS